MKVTKKNIPTNKTVICMKQAQPQNPELVAQFVNEMRELIQEVKTIIEAVTEKLSKDPNTRVATSLERQADRKCSEALTSEVTSVAGPLQTSPKKETTGNLPPLTGEDMVQNRKKIDPDQEQELPQKRANLSS